MAIDLAAANGTLLPLEDGVPYGNGFTRIVRNNGHIAVMTKPATMTLPFCRRGDGSISVCLLRQGGRDDGTKGSIIKISGGYNITWEVTEDAFREGALAHTKIKLGLEPGQHELVLWRLCKGVGLQYAFPIYYTFLQSPTAVGAPTKDDCRPCWMSLEEAEGLMTAVTSELFDDFSLSMLTILRHRIEEIEVV